MLALEEQVRKFLEWGVDISSVLSFLKKYGYVSVGCLSQLNHLKQTITKKEEVESLDRLRSLSGLLMESNPNKEGKHRGEGEVRDEYMQMVLKQNLMGIKKEDLRSGK